MGKIFVVGIGPGSHEKMTLEADEALRNCDIIIGYTVYVDLVREQYAEKEFLTTPMRKETERCRLAFERASEGKSVAMICSGDAGIYGMAGLILKLEREFPGVEVAIIPGVSAVVSGAALLGAPLMHDFAVISLSDILTPMEKIERRLDAAASADFVICLYNPSSHKRRDHLRRACDIMLRHKPPSTICGVARNIGRDGEGRQVLTLGELRDTEVDMFCTVFIGNSETEELAGNMVTPRGYTNE